MLSRVRYEVEVVDSLKLQLHRWLTSFETIKVNETQWSLKINECFFRPLVIARQMVVDSAPRSLDAMNSGSRPVVFPTTVNTGYIYFIYPNQNSHIERNKTPSSSASSSHICVLRSRAGPGLTYRNSFWRYSWPSHCTNHRLYSSSHCCFVVACHRYFAAGAGIKPSSSQLKEERRW